MEETQEKKEEEKALFAVFCEAEGYEKPLVLTGLTFARLIDDVVVYYEEEKPFFIDGAPLSKKKIRKLKILRQGKNFSFLFGSLYHKLSSSDKAIQKIYGEQYYTRLEACLRAGCEDVTSQVIKAFDNKIRPKLKDYLSKRDDLIQAAYQVFITGMKILSGT